MCGLTLPSDLNRYAGEVVELERQLAQDPPGKGGILFYGSSTMKRWRADGMCYAQMKPLPVTNLGFGGSTAAEALHYYSRLVLPVEPRILVYYEGANDFSRGYAPEDVATLTHRLFERARRDMPGIRFVIIPIKLCPGLAHRQELVKCCNEMFAQYVKRHEDTYTVDVTSLTYDDKGGWRTDIYVQDGLHHNRRGYEELAALVKPVLDSLYF